MVWTENRTVGLPNLDFRVCAYCPGLDVASVPLALGLLNDGHSVTVVPGDLMAAMIGVHDDSGDGVRLDGLSTAAHDIDDGTAHLKRNLHAK